MTGQDFQDKLDALVSDLQTKGKGQTVDIMFRNANNTPNILPLSSSSAGVVNAAQLAAVQAFVDDMKFMASDYTDAYAPVSAALEAFKTASAPHQALQDAASLARKNLSDALAGDAAYQTAKTNLDTARNDPGFVEIASDYRINNVSENFSELSNAKGSYIV